MDDLRNDLEQEKIGRNYSDQYHRTSINIKLCGVPAKPGEDVRGDTASNPVTLDVVRTICRQLDVHLPNDAVDVVHRLGDGSTAPIIIRFASKSACTNFVRQKGKFNIASESVDLSNVQAPTPNMVKSLCEPPSSPVLPDLLCVTIMN